MAEEMRHHLDAQLRRNLAAGMSLDEAHYAAQRSFGGLEQIEGGVLRDQRGWPWARALRVGSALWGPRAAQESELHDHLRKPTLRAASASGSTRRCLRLYNAVALAAPAGARAGCPRQDLRRTSARRGAFLPGFFSYPEYLDYRDGNSALSGLTGSRQ